MRVPTRKYDKYPRPKTDPNLTPQKYQALLADLEKLKKVKRPREAEEVKRLALMGDFSENAGYQLAKARLRGINQRILEIENLIARAEIIVPNTDRSRVRLGHTVSLEQGEKTKRYQILGSAETNPSLGIISHNSPLGAALLGHRSGDTVRLNGKEYRIMGIE